MNELTPAQKEAYARAKSTVVDLFSFELRHSTFPGPIRMISHDKDIDVTLEDTAPVDGGDTVTFIGVAFKAPPDNVNTDSGNSFTVVVNGISDQALPYLKAANETDEPIETTVRYVTYDVRTVVVIGVSRPLHMQVRNFRTSALSVQMSLGFTNLNNRTLDV